MKVSIIIPIYKVEPYIERCIRSVLAQTYRNLEVILVDDCSPDNSMTLAKKVIDESGVQDITFVYLSHDHNRGLSAARNTGIDAATGEYIYFLDSDDEITSNCIEQLRMPLRDRKYDFVIACYKLLGADKVLPQLNIEGEHEDVLDTYRNSGWYMMAWNKLVNLTMLRNHFLYFQEGLIHEDELWSFQLAYTTKNMFAIRTATYLYYIRQGSIVTSESRTQRIEACLNIASLMWEFLDSHGLSEDIEANNHVEIFIERNCPFFQSSTVREGYRFYKRLRKGCHRNKNIFRHLSFQSEAGFKKYFHYLIPTPVAYVLKRITRFIIKAVKG